MRSDQSSWKRLCRMPKVVSSARVTATTALSARTTLENHANTRCFDTRGEMICRLTCLSSRFNAGRGSPWHHQFSRCQSRRNPTRVGFTCCSTCAKGCSNRLASAKGILSKSITQMSSGRRVTASPFAQGRITSAFERPCGFGRPSHARAVCPGTSNGPFF